MKIDVFNVLGKSVSSIEISDSIFNIEPHKQSMFDLVMSERANSRSGNHNTKNRSEVSGGGKKPWRQKGTGRARQGSIRSPQWRGGGIVFGPTSQKNYELKVNKKVVKLAKKSGWSVKAKANEIFILDDIEFNTPSTSDFKQMLKNFNLETSKVIILLVGDSSDYNVYLSSRNLVNVLATPYNELSLENILGAEAIFMSKKVFELVEKGLK